jgi:hypothetical protein
MKDIGRFSDHLALDEGGSREHGARFATHLREQPHYKEIVRQAQALVDLLH